MTNPTQTNRPPLFRARRRQACRRWAHGVIGRMVPGVACLAAALMMGTAARASQDDLGGQDKIVVATTDGNEAPKDARGGSRHKTALWRYSGKKGPERWGGLSKDYALCKSGAMQSPIDIAGFTGASTQPIRFDYGLTPLSIVNNGHTVMASYAPGSGITVGGKRYELVQFHFHTPSEHSVAGKRAAIEMHLVHKAANGELAVIAVLFTGGAKNLALGEIASYLPMIPGPVKVRGRVLINARDLLPASRGYYRYIGSLTTPPCSQGVQWFVMARPVQVQPSVVARFTRALGYSARPIQALNQRLLLAPIARD